tara:strand:+ start:850 stop:1236 length:387 start_codon:yes stop_codon:yes gene_type:complete
MTNSTDLKNAISQLFLGEVISHAEFTRLNKKIDRSEAKAATESLVVGTCEAIMALLESDLTLEDKYFSVKKTSNSVGFMDFIEADRNTVLRALKRLVVAEKIRKIGLVGGVEKAPNEVNAFQIRYARA